MKKTFIKISLTLCALLLISVPAQSLAAEKITASNCNLASVKNCTVNQADAQKKLQDITSKSNSNCKNTKNLVKGTDSAVKGTNCKAKATDSAVKGTATTEKGTTCNLQNAKATNCTAKEVKGVTSTVKAADTTKKCGVNNCDSVKNCAVNNCEDNNNCKVNNCSDKNNLCNVLGTDILSKIGNTSCTKVIKTITAANNTATKPVDNNTSTKPSTAKPSTTTPATTKPSATTPSTTAPTTTKPSPTADSNAGIGSYEQQVANIVNKERAANGLPALKVNTNLSAVAEKKAEDMRDKNYFSHTSPTYGSPFDMMKQFGISYKSAGENIAKGQRTPEEVMTGWMNSAGHRANILNADFTEIGIGYVTDSNGNTYWVQQFIRP